jgi:hypothetical protein
MAQLKKQDRQGARTPAALDRQYNIGGNLMSFNKTMTKQNKQAEALLLEVKEIIKTLPTEAKIQWMIDASMKDMREMVDSAIVDNILSGTITMLENDTATKVGQYAFYNHPTLERIDLSAVHTIEAFAFKGASSLMIVILRYEGVVELQDASAFEGTPIADGIGSIFVPSSLLPMYQSNWSAYTERLLAIEDYPEICG